MTLTGGGGAEETLLLVSLYFFGKIGGGGGQKPPSPLSRLHRPCIFVNRELPFLYFVKCEMTSFSSSRET